MFDVLTRTKNRLAKFLGSSKKKPIQKRGFRPLVEVLEERAVPTAYIWANNMSDGKWDTSGNWDSYSSGLPVMNIPTLSYSVYDGSTLLATVSVNQKLNPSGGLALDGTQFQSLGSYTVTSGTLKVVLNDSGANGVVVADSMVAIES